MRILFVRDGKNEEGHEVAGFCDMQPQDARKLFRGTQFKFSPSMPTPVPFKLGSDGWLAKHVLLVDEGEEDTKRFKKPGFYLAENVDADECAARLGLPEGTIQQLCKAHSRRTPWEVQKSG